MFSLLRFFFFLFLFGICSCSSSQRELSLDQRVLLKEKLSQILEVATAYMRLGDRDSLDKAHASLEVARELEPRDPRVLDAFGCIAWRRGQIALAERYFKSAISEDVGYDRAYAHLALVAESRGDVEAAGDLLRMALELNPLNYRARNNYAAHLYESAQTERERRKAYEELLKAYSEASAGDVVIADNMELFRSGR